MANLAPLREAQWRLAGRVPLHRTGAWQAVAAINQIVRDQDRALEVFMAVVAERGRFRPFAGAEHHRPRAGGGPFQRLKPRALVRTVAQRLTLGAPATAPPV